MIDAKPAEQAALAPPPAYRWLVLLVISLAMFGNYYVYDSIAPLARLLKADLHFSDANIGLLYSIYSIPNIFMVLISGIILDRIGTKKALFAFTAICLVGSLITASQGSLLTMATGRLVFGLGAESMIIAVNSAIVRWFRGSQLSFAFGLNLTLARLGSFAVDNSPTWANALYKSWQGPLLLAAGAGVICAAAGLVYWFMERHAERHYVLSEAGHADKVVWNEIFRFDRSYWLLVALCVTFYCAIFPFRAFAVKYFVEAHHSTLEQGGFLLSMLDLAAMIATPLFGLLVERVANRSVLMMFGSGLLVPVFLILAYTGLSPFVPMSMLGVSYSLIPAVLWPSVAHVVDPKRLGTAYGLMTMIQNIGLSVFPWLIGATNDAAGAGSTNPAGYHPGLWILASLGFFGLLFAYLLRRRETGLHAHGLETIRARV